MGWPILPVTLPVTLPATLPATRPSSVIHPLTAVTPIPDLPLPLPVSARPTPSASPPTLHIRVTAIPDSLAIRDIPPTPDMAPLSGSVDTPLPVTASGVRPAPPGFRSIPHGRPHIQRRRPRPGSAHRNCQEIDIRGAVADRGRNRFEIPGENSLGRSFRSGREDGVGYQTHRTHAIYQPAGATLQIQGHRPGHQRRHPPRR